MNILYFVIITLLIYIFTFANGIKDGANSVATIIASRSMKPKKAIIIAAVMEFIAPFAAYLIGFGVAGTVSKLVNIDLSGDYQGRGILFIASAVLTAIIWDSFMLKVKMPSSSSHSLIGGLMGAGIAAYGFYEINWLSFLTKVVLVMFMSPFLGFIAGFIIMKLTDFFTRHSDISVNRFFIKGQAVNMVFLSLNHSLNDSQKSIGIVMLLWTICFGAAETVPLWMAACAGLALSLGLLLGGYRIIKTVGSGIYRVRPKHSFASQLSSSIVILASSVSGAPVSASQIVSSSIMGVGTAQKLNAVRWLVVKRIFLSWFITIPFTGLLSFIIFSVFKIILL